MKVQHHDCLYGQKKKLFVMDTQVIYFKNKKIYIRSCVCIGCPFMGCGRYIEIEVKENNAFF